MIKIFTDTTASLTIEEYRSFGIQPIPVIINQGEKSKEDLFEISNNEFYQIQRAGGKFTTSQPSPETYIKLFKPHIEAGDEIIAIMMSSKISSSFDTANMVVDMLGTDKITIYDSKASGFGQATLAIKAKELADSGLTRSDIINTLDSLRSRIKVYIIVESLRYLYEGGRLSGAQALIGSVIQIKPIIWFDQDGNLTTFEKIRSLKAAKSRLLELLKDEESSHGIERIYLHYGDNFEEANDFAKSIQGFTEFPISFTKLSPVLGTHTGPDILGIVIVTKE